MIIPHGSHSTSVPEHHIVQALKIQMIQIDLKVFVFSRLTPGQH